ncbi:hypothetical protein [Streptomyces sp. NPDC086787]|uniref:hypothetical protein n=1 Tax=Streptomyces sp. NPDC086787 TaxID=3365759 RepID=UPI0037F416E0
MDVQSYGSKNDRAQSETQHDLPRLLDEAARKCGLDRTSWHIQSKGDEQLAVTPMNGDEPRLVDDYVRHLVAGLGHYNAQRVPTARMRLRAALHHGPVALADNGFAGTAVVVTARLLNSGPLYGALDAHPEADLALILSDDMYRSTVAGGHTTLVPSDFSRVAVSVKEYESAAYITVPTLGAPAATGNSLTGTTGTGTTGTGTTGTGTTGTGAGHDYRADRINVTHMNGPVDARGAVFGFGSADA